MSTLDTLPGRVSAHLSPAIGGDVFVPGEDGYDDARQAFELAVDQRPSAVVLPESASVRPAGL